MNYEFDKHFTAYMQRFLPAVPTNSEGWWHAKKAWLGGVGHGLTVPTDDANGIADVLTTAFQEADLFLLILQVPEEHRPANETGFPCLTETGYIHLATLMEEQDPENAAEIRLHRYRVQSVLQAFRQAKEGGANHG